MQLIRKIRNVLRGATQRYAPQSLKRRLWDSEYRSGRWNSLDSMNGDCVYSHVEKWSRRGRILDLGCGPGTTGIELRPDCYSMYVGVDVSEVAVLKARTRAIQAGRSSTNEYVQSDIATYSPDQTYDVLLLGDSLYYVAATRVLDTLVRYSASLTPGGVFIVRTRDDQGRYSDMLTNIEDNFLVLEKALYFDDRISVIVFRPRDGSGQGVGVHHST